MTDTSLERNPRMTNERIAEIKTQLDSLEEDDNPWYEAHTSYMRELVTYIEHLEQRLAKLEAVRGAALLVTHERKLVWYRKLEEALAAAENTNDQA